MRLRDIHESIGLKHGLDQKHCPSFINVFNSLFRNPIFSCKGPGSVDGSPYLSRQLCFPRVLEEKWAGGNVEQIGDVEGGGAGGVWNGSKTGGVNTR